MLNDIHIERDGVLSHSSNHPHKFISSICMKKKIIQFTIYFMYYRMTGYLYNILYLSFYPLQQHEKGGMGYNIPTIL